MHPVEVSHIAKSFDTTQAVKDVSFNVMHGEIFGLLGPNGAGKTTIIRMILDILKPDAGTISVLYGPMNEEKKEQIGYMPEDRGLYQDISLEACLTYLGKLKGIPVSDIKPRLDSMLTRFDLDAHRKKKVKQLSKGMQQKAQIISTILHHPELVVIDEPFTALDPINVQLVKNLIRELRDEGTTIIMSTHQMHQVEELCDRILLIDDGISVLHGSLNEIRKRFSGDEVVIRVEGTFPVIPGVETVSTNNGTIKLALEKATNPQEVLKSLTANDVFVEQFEIAVPSLDEIFIKVVGEGEVI
jgi:ABC-2 type transport system ATP-binding protein